MSILYGGNNDIFLKEEDLEKASKTTKTITRQKIYAVLRKAGYKNAKWHKSGQIRGWGSWTEGYTFKNETGIYIYLTYLAGSSISARRKSQEELKQLNLTEIKKYITALEKIGIKASIKETGSISKIYLLEVLKEQ